MSVLGMILILYALGVLMVLLLVLFGVVSITIIKEAYVETKEKKNPNRG